MFAIRRLSIPCAHSEGNMPSMLLSATSLHNKQEHRLASMDASAFFVPSAWQLHIHCLHGKSSLDVLLMLHAHPVQAGILMHIMKQQIHTTKPTSSSCKELHMMIAAHDLMFVSSNSQLQKCSLLGPPRWQGAYQPVAPEVQVGQKTQAAPGRREASCEPVVA